MIISEATQQLGGETVVFLYQLDLTPIGEPSVLYFTREMGGIGGSTVISFGGTIYEFVDIDASGFEWTGVGSNPQPRLRLSNVTSFASGLLLQYGDLIGASLHRIRTFARFLDGGSDAAYSGTAGLGYTMESYRIDQKVTHNKVFIELALASAMDQEGRMLPMWTALRDTCRFRYRIWNAPTGSYDYSRATCPYTGGGAFDINGNPVTPDLDRASLKDETCCVQRFGAGNPRPFGGFKGMSRAT